MNPSMRNENQNNWQSISDRLDGMDALPGEAPPETDRIWGGIQGRLRPGKKRAAFWWAAAALLVCLSAAGVLRFSSREAASLASVRVKASSAKKKQPVPASPVTGLDEAAAGSPTVFAGRATRSALEPSTAPDIVPVPAATRRPLTARPDRQPAFSERTVIRKDPPSDNNAVPVHTTAALTDSVQATPPGTVFTRAPVKPDSSALVSTARRAVRVVLLNDLEEPGFSETGRDNAIKGNVFSPGSRFPIGYFTGPSATSANAGLAAPCNSFFRITLDR